MKQNSVAVSILPLERCLRLLVHSIEKINVELNAVLFVICLARQSEITPLMLVAEETLMYDTEPSKQWIAELSYKYFCNSSKADT